MSLKDFYGCGDPKIGPCVPWQKWADLSDEYHDTVRRVLAVIDSAEDAGEHHVRTSDIRRAVNG